MRSFAAAAATVSVAVAAAAMSVACGGSEQPATGGPAVVPADAAVYVSVQSDLDSAQWKQVEKLVLRFPDGPGAVERLHGDLGNGVNYEEDLEPALGPTVELVWLDFRNDGEDVVALTQPDDEGKLRELARKSEEPVVVDEVEGWSAVARSQAVIDRYRDALDAGTLGDDDRYDETTSELPTEALAQVYVDGERTTNALQSTLQERGAEPGALDSAGRLDSGAAALEAADDGFRLTALFRTHGVPDEVTDVGALLGEVPAGAFAAVDFHGSRSTSEQLTPERLATCWRQHSAKGTRGRRPSPTSRPPSSTWTSTRSSTPRSTTDSRSAPRPTASVRSARRTLASSTRTATGPRWTRPACRTTSTSWHTRISTS